MVTVSFTIDELAFIWEELEGASKQKGIYGRTANRIRAKVVKASPQASQR